MASSPELMPRPGGRGLGLDLAEREVVLGDVWGLPRPLTCTPLPSSVPAAPQPPAQRPTSGEAVQDGLQPRVSLQVVVLKEDPPEGQDGPRVLGQEPREQRVESLRAALLLLQTQGLLRPEQGVGPEPPQCPLPAAATGD